MLLGRPKNLKQVLKMGGFLLIGLVISSCGPKGPIITTCSPRIAKSDFDCINQGNKKEIFLAAKTVDNWIFYTAADTRSILTACSNGNGWPKVKVFSFDASNMAYVWYNEVDGSSGTLAYASSAGLIGSSPVDVQMTIEYCSNLQALRAKLKN